MSLVKLTAFINPAKPFLCALWLSGHIVVETCSIMFSLTKRSSHQYHGIREGLCPWNHITFSYRFFRQTLYSCGNIYMPFSPVPQTSKFDITDQSISAKMLSKCINCPFVILYHLFIIIIRSISLSILHIIPGSRMISFVI